MPKSRVWTAVVSLPNSDSTLVAQCKGSFSELMKRLVADDPVWRANVKRRYLRRFDNKDFRRGLAIKCLTAFDVFRGRYPWLS